ncbi:DNA/RNA helicase domain-containing protein [Polynucleobacter sp. IMCC 29146]
MNQEKANKKADGIISNTYSTLMTLGINGYYVFCTDPET